MRISPTRLLVRLVMGTLLALALSCQPPAPPTPPPVPPPVPQTWTPLLLAQLPEHTCPWTDTPPTIDGDPNDAAWSQSTPITNFTIPWEAGNKPPAKPTKARLLWDRDHLYFLAEMEDDTLFADIKEYRS